MIARALLIALALCGCDVVFHLDRFDQATAGYRKPITITQTGSTALTDFPLSITAAADPELVAHALPSGLDLTFTAEDGTALDQEIVSFDSATGGYNAWVRLPVLAPGVTKLHLDYGGDPTTSPASNVWASYDAVWHMDDPLTIEHDATNHGHSVIPTTTTPASVIGIVGKARSYNGTSDQLCAHQHGDTSLDVDMSSFSYSMWVYVTASAGIYDIPFTKGGASPGNAGYDVELGTGPWTANIDGDCTPACPLDEIAFAAETLGAWVLITIVVDRATQQLTGYIDGVLGSTLAIPMLASLTGPADVCLGGGDIDYFSGLLDEVRVYNGALKPDWILTEYTNYTKRDSLITIGHEQTR